MGPAGVAGMQVYEFWLERGACQLRELDAFCVARRDGPPVLAKGELVCGFRRFSQEVYLSVLRSHMSYLLR